MRVVAGVVRGYITTDSNTECLGQEPNSRDAAQVQRGEVSHRLLSVRTRVVEAANILPEDVGALAVEEVGHRCGRG